MPFKKRVLKKELNLTSEQLSSRVLQQQLSLSDDFVDVKALDAHCFHLFQGIIYLQYRYTPEFLGIAVEFIDLLLNGLRPHSFDQDPLHRSAIVNQNLLKSIAFVRDSNNRMAHTALPNYFHVLTESAFIGSPQAIKFLQTIATTICAESAYQNHPAFVELNLLITEILTAQQAGIAARFAKAKELKQLNYLSRFTTFTQFQYFFNKLSPLKWMENADLFIEALVTFSLPAVGAFSTALYKILRQLMHPETSTPLVEAFYTKLDAALLELKNELQKEREEEQKIRQQAKLIQPQVTSRRLNQANSMARIDVKSSSAASFKRRITALVDDKTAQSTKKTPAASQSSSSATSSTASSFTPTSQISNPAALAKFGLLATSPPPQTDENTPNYQGSNTSKKHCRNKARFRAEANSVIIDSTAAVAVAAPKPEAKVIPVAPQYDFLPGIYKNMVTGTKNAPVDMKFAELKEDHQIKIIIFLGCKIMLRTILEDYRPSTQSEADWHNQGLLTAPEQTLHRGENLPTKNFPVTLVDPDIYLRSSTAATSAFALLIGIHQLSGCSFDRKANFTPSRTLSKTSVELEEKLQQTAKNILSSKNVLFTTKVKLVRVESKSDRAVEAIAVNFSDLTTKNIAEFFASLKDRTRAEMIAAFHDASSAASKRSALKM